MAVLNWQAGMARKLCLAGRCKARTQVQIGVDAGKAARWHEEPAICV